MIGLRLERLTFCNLENASPLGIEVLGTFIPDENGDAYQKATQWFTNHKPEVLYIGYDNKVYPRYRLINETLL